MSILYEGINVIGRFRGFLIRYSRLKRVKWLDIVLSSLLEGKLFWRFFFCKMSICCLGFFLILIFYDDIWFIVGVE